MTPGTVGETYVAALQHGLADPGEATLVGVVGRPTGRFDVLVDENHPELGPPEELRSAMRTLRESFAARGMCEEGAHNAAWAETEFAARYREYLDGAEAAREVLRTLVSRITAGEDLHLVCFEGENVRCHRHLLRDHLRERLDARPSTPNAGRD